MTGRVREHFLGSLLVAHRALKVEHGLESRSMDTWFRMAPGSYAPTFWFALERVSRFRGTCKLEFLQMRYAMASLMVALSFSAWATSPSKWWQ